MSATSHSNDAATKPLTGRRFVADSLRHHRRIHLAVALGVAVATAVLTGALLVGDSVRGSLKQTALDRLGTIDEVLVTDKFFRTELAAEVRSAYDSDSKPLVVPGIVLEGAVTQPDSKAYAAHVTLIGTAENFRNFGRRDFGGGDAPTALPPQPDDEVWVNEPLAKELGVADGIDVIIRLPASREVPEESPLGKKTDTIANSARLKLRLIPAHENIAGFNLRPSQQTPKNAFLSLATLQKILDRKGKANALFSETGVSGNRSDAAAQLADVDARHKQALHPTLADYGLKWSRATPGYFNLTSDRMLFDPATAAAALAAYKEYDPQPVFTYLANTIALGKKEIPYSTIAAMDIVDRPTLGPLRTPEGAPIDKIADDEIVLTSWAAGDLGAKPGDVIRIAYFKPESTHSDVEETEASFKLKAVAELKPENDPLISAELTPELKGVTDQLKMNDWDPPFPYEARRIRKVDEDYWDDFKATPKAFVSAAAGRKLWSSRFGDVTSLRIAPREGLTLETLAAKFQPDPESLGLAFQPIKLRAIEAASGTTPFEGLFIGFSFFIIAAAVMLTSLLFRLGIEQRAVEIGVLLAVGLGLRQVRRLLLVEGLAVAAVGAFAGIALGVGYAWLMLAGLRTLWLDAVTVPFLELFVTAKSLIIGYLVGVLVSLATIALALRALQRLSVRRLLGGQASESDLGVPIGKSAAKSRRFAWSGVLLWGGLVLAVVSVAAAMNLTDEAQASAFFGSAAFVLIALLALTRRRLAAARFGSLVEAGRGRVAVLAIRNAGRNPGRSTLTIGLVAAAAFLIVAVSAFRIAPPGSYVEKTSGTGGFALVGQSDVSILPDMNTDDGRIDLNLSQAQRKALGDMKAYACRFKPGDDASCLNLYQTEQPRVVGVTKAFIERGGFSWAATSAATDPEKQNPWLLLDHAFDVNKQTVADTVPIVLDQATAIYSLHLSGVGDNFDLKDATGRPIHCRVVGLLRNSVLQGSVLMSEANFKRSFPEMSGYRFFLIEAPPDRAAEVGKTLEAGLSDFGFDVQSSVDLLAGFLAVQNTYLSTFQTLGGLGLLLGTFGLSVVQLRNALERRGELALFRAVGLSRSLLGRLVFWENAALLIGGLACGAIAAAIAVVPHAIAGSAGIPWAWLGGTLGVVLAVGLLTGAIVVARVLRMPILASLRGE
jgi:ABC-type antimicrobial peptide transport system permease subunit